MATTSNPLVADAHLPICTLCGTQFPAPRSDCLICLDARQWTTETGQKWTSLKELDKDHEITIIPDKEDDRISFISTKPGVGIGQAPILIQTSRGSYIWDCSAFISPSLIRSLQSLSTPLKAIAISHPHFYTTSLTWARALNVPLILAKEDKAWYPRLEEVKYSEINWFDGEVTLNEGIKVIRCGGHFPGSSVLIWDRSLEPSSSRGPRSGIAFVADTLMVQPSRRGFTYQWSVPNMIPLGPEDILGILRSLQEANFDQATSTWQGRFIRKDAKKLMYASAKRQLDAMGWEWDGVLEKGEGELKASKHVKV